jgi:hypothetical protein
MGNTLKFDCLDNYTINKIRNSKSDAEVRRLLKESFKYKKDDNQVINIVVIPRIVPDYIYIELEGIKCEIYGGLWEQMDNQVAFVDGQCATIELVKNG